MKKRILSKKIDSDRGEIVTVELSKELVVNGNRITQVVIELDHLNRGLDKKGKLNTSKRTNFSVEQVLQFIELLHQEDILAREYEGPISRFEVKIDCPVKGKFFDKLFILIFDLDHRKPELFLTVTLFPKSQSRKSR